MSLRVTINIGLFPEPGDAFSTRRSETGAPGRFDMKAKYAGTLFLTLFLS